MGQGLMAVNRPRTSADTMGVDVFAYRLFRNSSMH